MQPQRAGPEPGDGQLRRCRNDDGPFTACNYDFTVRGTLTFAPGETTKVVRIELDDDANAEGFETFILRSSVARPTRTIARPVAQISIVDDDTVVDTPKLFVRDVVVDEKAGTASFVVMLGGPTGQASNGTVTVNYATANGTATAGADYVASSGTLTFAPARRSRPWSSPSPTTPPSSRRRRST